MIESCTVSIKKIIKTGPMCAEIILKKEAIITCVPLFVVQITKREQQNLN